jgi:hypothetical protein
MITHDPRWSLPRGNTLVPSRWQATWTWRQEAHSATIQDQLARAMRIPAFPDSRVVIAAGSSGRVGAKLVAMMAPRIGLAR